MKPENPEHEQFDDEGNPTIDFPFNCPICGRVESIDDLKTLIPDPPKEERDEIRRSI